MSDLPARLRAETSFSESTEKLMDEAADRIEELEANQAEYFDRNPTYAWLQGRVTDLEDKLATIRYWHHNDTDARLCDLCGGGGGRWPCDTLREIDATNEPAGRTE